IQVYLHFTWFIIAALEITRFASRYHSPIWGAAEYLALFLIVLLHEFGHAFACRQTGGQADRIVLWPLGGVAFVQPPPRAGAYLWSIAAGPLVNAVLFPFLMFATFVAVRQQWRMTHPDLLHFVVSVFYVNGAFLFFVRPRLVGARRRILRSNRRKPHGARRQLLRRQLRASNPEFRNYGFGRLLTHEFSCGRSRCLNSVRNSTSSTALATSLALVS